VSQIGLGRNISKILDKFLRKNKLYNRNLMFWGG